MKLFIRDFDGSTRPFGSDKHDRLLLGMDGRTLSYFNMQNGDGSRYGDYRLCLADGMIPDEDSSMVYYEGEYSITKEGLQDEDN